MHLRYTELITKLMGCPGTTVDEIVTVTGSPGGHEKSYAVNITLYGYMTYSVYFALSKHMDHVVPYFSEGHIEDTHDVPFSRVDYWGRAHGYPDGIAHKMNMMEMKIAD